jgi:hypothetical protein
MAKRRNFKTTALASAAFALQSFKGTRELKILQNPKINKPIVLQLNFGMQANVAAWDVLKIMGKR